MNISSLNNSDEKSLNLYELFNNDNHAKIRIKDFTSDKYLSQNKQNIKAQILSYKLINRNNHKNIIANVVYLDYNYFITILNKEQYQNLHSFSKNYYISYLDNELNIISTNAYDKYIEKNYEIVILEINNNQFKYHEFDIIKPSMYLLFEQNNIEISYQVNDIIIQNHILSISDDYIVIDESSKLTIGSPLFKNNILIGLYYKKNGNNCYFFRLSNILNWLNKFSLITKQKKELITNPLYVPYSKEQMYYIILSLTNRITLLEELCNEMKNNK